MSRDDFGCPSWCVECAALVFSVAEDRDAAEDILQDLTILWDKVPTLQHLKNQE